MRVIASSSDPPINALALLHQLASSEEQVDPLNITEVFWNLNCGAVMIQLSQSKQVALWIEEGTGDVYRSRTVNLAISSSGLRPCGTSLASSFKLSKASIVLHRHQTTAAMQVMSITQRLVPHARPVTFDNMTNTLERKVCGKSHIRI